jgi:hypothetical protein
VGHRPSAPEAARGRLWVAAGMQTTRSVRPKWSGGRGRDAVVVLYHLDIEVVGQQHFGRLKIVCLTPHAANALPISRLMASRLISVSITSILRSSSPIFLSCSAQAALISALISSMATLALSLRR